MAKAKKSEENIKDKAKGIEELAKSKGLLENPFFLTTYHSLMVQIEMLDSLERAYKEDGATITKEYVKDRENVYIHPAVDKYTKISDSAMNKIIKLQEMCDKVQIETTEDEFNL